MKIKPLKDHIEDALNATRAAVEEGIVPGGRVAFIRAMRFRMRHRWLDC